MWRWAHARIRGRQRQPGSCWRTSAAPRTSKRAAPAPATSVTGCARHDRRGSLQLRPQYCSARPSQCVCCAGADGSAAVMASKARTRARPVGGTASRRCTAHDPRTISSTIFYAAPCPGRRAQHANAPRSSSKAAGGREERGCGDTVVNEQAGSREGLGAGGKRHPPTNEACARTGLAFAHIARRDARRAHETRRPTFVKCGLAFASNSLARSTADAATRATRVACILARSGSHGSAPEHRELRAQTNPRLACCTTSASQTSAYCAAHGRPCAWLTLSRWHRSVRAVGRSCRLLCVTVQSSRERLSLTHTRSRRCGRSSDAQRDELEASGFMAPGPPVDFAPEVERGSMGRMG